MAKKETLPCKHEFCFDCLETWKKQKHQCPLCRDLLYPKAIHYTRRNSYGENIESVQKFWMHFKQTERFLNFIAASFLLFQDFYPVSYAMLEFFCFLRAELIKIIETHYLFSVKFVEVVPTVRRKSLKEFKEFLWEKTNINIESLKKSPNFKKFVDNIRRQSLLNVKNNTSVFEQVKVEEGQLDDYIQEKIEYYTFKYWKSFFGCDCDCCRENLLSLSEISLEEPSYTERSNTEGSDILRTPSGTERSNILRTPSGTERSSTVRSATERSSTERSDTERSATERSSTERSDTFEDASVEDIRIAAQEMSDEENNRSDGENNDDEADESDDDESDDESAFDFEDYHFDLYDRIFEIMSRKKDVIKYARSEKYIEDLMWIVNTILKYPYYGGYIRDDLDQNNCFALENDLIIQFFYDQKPLLYMILSVFYPRKKKYLKH